MLIGNEVFSLG